MKRTVTSRVEELEKKVSEQEQLINALILDRANTTKEFANTLRAISVEKEVQQILDEFMKEVENEEL